MVYEWLGYILQRCSSDTTPDTAKMLLFIEKQAVVQILCQQLISFIDPRDPKKIQDVSYNDQSSHVRSPGEWVYFMPSLFFLCV